MFKRKYVMKPWKRKTSRFSPASLKKKIYRRNSKRNRKMRVGLINLKAIALIIILIISLFILL